MFMVTVSIVAESKESVEKVLQQMNLHANKEHVVFEIVGEKQDEARRLWPLHDRLVKLFNAVPRASKEVQSIFNFGVK